MDWKARRTALGLSRKDLAQRAGIDASALQLIELDQWSDDEAKQKLDACLTALENNGSPPAAEKPTDAG